MHELDDPKILNQVIDSLRQQLATPDIVKIESGNEFYIFSADYESKSVIIKVPKDRIFSNVNDAHIDAETLLEQELALMKHGRASGITQMPEPMLKISAAGFASLVMSYIPSDDSAPDSFKLGELLAKIHSITLPKIQLSAQENMEIPELIPVRISRRWRELGSLVDLPDLPETDILIARLETLRNKQSLLHMDFRQANFRMQQGEVTALLDWSNALIGHPALELARVAETNETDGVFLKGYASAKAIPKISVIAETILRLDTAIMLALVFLSEDPNPKRAPSAVDRVRKLHHRLMEEL